MRARYVVNLRLASVIGEDRQDDLYQVALPCARESETPLWAAGVEPDEDGWATYRIPWGAFRLTWRGYAQPVSPTMHLDRFTHFGLLLADGQSGDFAIELGEISAFRYPEEGHLQRDAQCGMVLNEQAGYTREFE